MPSPSFSHVRCWVFDLDNTLYAPEARLFDQIEALMTAYIVDRLGITPDDANALRARYWYEHGTTLAGLMAHHATDPDHFLDAVHDIDLSALAPDPVLGQRIATLPGRRIVYTNGSRSHARRVLAARGLTGAFDAIYGIEDAGYEPKPRRTAFDRVFAAAEVPAPQAAMFEDDARNLEVPSLLGMRTVLVGDDADHGPHVHHRTRDLSGFLDALP